MTEEKKYPIAEIFTSPQGEGLWAGTLMTFVRMAGCSVGKPQKERAEKEHFPVYVERCCSYDGRGFDCDTDFRTKEVLTVSQILERFPISVKHACITGGEPLNHDLFALCIALADHGVQSHVETSGTVLLPTKMVGIHPRIWIAVSPKKGVLVGMIAGADEIKLLVDQDFDIQAASDLVKDHPLVFIQPINQEHTLNESNVKLCLAIQRQKPEWRISLQSHKILGVR